MKWESADFKVGMMVIGAAVMVMGTLVWLSPAVTDRTQPLYTTYDRIDGIKMQDPVLLRGYQVGRVSGIEPTLAPNGSLQFRVAMKIDWTLEHGERLPIPVGTRARLVPPPMIGSGYITLEPPPESRGSLMPGMTIEGVRNTAALDQMQALADSIARNLNVTLASARLMMDTLTRTASTANQTAVYARDELPKLFGGLQQELVVADSLLRDMRTVTPTAVASIDTAQALLRDAHRTVVSMGQLLDQRQPEMSRVIANLDTTSTLLSHFMRQISRHPYKVLTGVTPEPVQAPPKREPVATGARSDSGCAGAGCIVAKRDSAP